MSRIVGGWFPAVVCLAGLTLVFFGPALAPGRQLAYRDFADFYYPLYQRVQQEWDAGRLPLWSSEENAGTPMLGSPTAAVLYPGKLIYASLPYPWAAKVYVLAHVLLAFGATVGLLRSWGVSRVGATLGGLAYAFGAPVLTQYSNVVFLVGAAWMPLAFLFAERWTRLGKPRALAGLALVLALQVLGGDPEAAYLGALASGCYAAGRWIIGEPPGRWIRLAIAGVGLVLAYGCLLGLEVARLPDPLSQVLPMDFVRPWWQLAPSTASLLAWLVFAVVLATRGRRSGLGGPLLGLLGACVLGAALTGVQLVPTLEFIGQSTRNDQAPHFDIYAHSTHPARLAEWAWPNAFGKTPARDHKWLAALPPTSDHRIWMTSVYLGGLTLLLAANAAGFRGEEGPRAWMAGVALFGILAGFGTFGSPLFWARAASGTETHLGTVEESEPVLPRADGRLRDGDGGAYWFLASTLPGFRSFRYPGKLFVPVALGMAALAGMGFDGLVAGRRRAGSSLAWLLLLAGSIGLGFAIARPKEILDYLTGLEDDAASVFGPFDPSGAAIDLRSALIHGSTVMAAFLVLAKLAPRRPLVAGVLALLAMTVDLGLANRGEIATVPQAAYEVDSKVLAAIKDAERDDPGAGPYRIFRLHGWVPLSWTHKSSPDRIEQIVRWERETLRPKYEEPLRVPSTFAYGTAELADYGPFFEQFPLKLDPARAQQLNIPSDRPVFYLPRRGFDLWNTRYFITPTGLIWTNQYRGFGSLLAHSKAIYPPPFTGPDRKANLDRYSLEEDVQVFRNLSAYPRAWVVHKAIPVGPTEKLKPADRRRVMTELLYQDDMLWHQEGRNVIDPRVVAWAEAPPVKLAGLAGAREGSEPVKVLQADDPTRVELEVTLQSPGLVILSDIYYPGWTLEIDGQPTEILRVNRAMRGAIVPAGPHRLVYTYRPSSLSVGIGLSAVGLLAWLGLVAFGRSSRGRDS